MITCWSCTWSTKCCHCKGYTFKYVMCKRHTVSSTQGCYFYVTVESHWNLSFWFHSPGEYRTHLFLRLFTSENVLTFIDAYEMIAYRNFNRERDTIAAPIGKLAIRMIASASTSHTRPYLQNPTLELFTCDEIALLLSIWPSLLYMLRGVILLSSVVIWCQQPPTGERAMVTAKKHMKHHISSGNCAHSHMQNGLSALKRCCMGFRCMQTVLFHTYRSSYVFDRISDCLI